MAYGMTGDQALEIHNLIGLINAANAATEVILKQAQERARLAGNFFLDEHAADDGLFNERDNRVMEAIARGRRAINEQFDALKGALNDWTPDHGHWYAESTDNCMPQ
jgi:hypothetical protein